MPLYDALFSNYSVDLTAVYDNNFNQVFASAHPVKATVSETTKVMQHPVETGIVITDHKVIQPTEIEMSLILTAGEYRTVYQQIRQVYQKGTLLTVQTKTATYRNMLIYEIPHEESPDMYDAVPVAVKMREVLFVTATFGKLPASKVAKKTQASTTPRGQQTASPPTASLAARGYDGLKSVIKPFLKQ